MIVAGIVIANLRDRLIYIFLPDLDGDADVSVEIEDGEWSGGDPIDYIVANNLVVVAGLALLGILAVLIGLFYLSWRFHTFRITGDDVEVRSGVLFRTHRRAPLDRVQGVNLTRPMFARLVGMAKLEVVGAGLDANVKLEYLSTSNAESVRADILRLASGNRLEAARGPSAPRGSRAGAVGSVVSAGITGLIQGAEEPVDEPESVVHISVGRLVASRLLSTSTLWLIAIIVAIIVGSIAGTPWVLFVFVPALLGFGAYWVRYDHPLAALLDRTDPERRAHHVRSVHDDHRDPSAGSRARDRGRSVHPVATVRLVGDHGQPALGPGDGRRNG